MEPAPIESNRHVIAARRAPCAANAGIEHVTSLKLEDGSQIEHDDVRALIDAGRQYFMRAPSTMRAVDADGSVMSVAGMPLILQVGECPDCKERRVFA